MKWMVVKPIKKDSEKLEVIKFAWLPTKVDVGYTDLDSAEGFTCIFRYVWLERYKAHYRWSKVGGFATLGGWEYESGESL